MKIQLGLLYFFPLKNCSCVSASYLLLFSSVTEDDIILFLDSCLESKHLDYVIVPAFHLLFSEVEVRFGDLI